MSTKEKNWKEIPIGGLIVVPGSSHQYKTGDWRTYKPVHSPENCINCLFCWLHCPDSSVIVKDGKMCGFDYDHCKGCGVCAKICPGKPNKDKVKVKAIKMEL